VHPHGTSIERPQRYIFVHRPLCGGWHVARLRETDGRSGRGPIDRILSRAVRRTCGRSKLPDDALNALSDDESIYDVVTCKMKEEWNWKEKNDKEPSRESRNVGSSTRLLSCCGDFVPIPAFRLYTCKKQHCIIGKHAYLCTQISAFPRREHAAPNEISHVNGRKGVRGWRRHGKGVVRYFVARESVSAQRNWHAGH